MKFLFVVAILAFVSHQGVCQSLQWSAPLEVPSGGTFGSTRPRITTCNGVAVIIWSNEATKQVVSSRFSATGFSAPVLITPSGFEAFAADWTGPEVDAYHDTLFVSFTDNNTPPGPAYVVRSINGGMTFGDTVRVPLDGNEVPRFASVKVMPGGNPMVAMMRFDSMFADPVNVVSTSLDGGATFQPYVPASNIIPGEPCDCCPVSIVANDDVAAVLYRNNDSNIRDSWASLSFDGAVSFTQSARVDSNNWMIMSCPSSGPDGYLFNDTLVTVFMNGGGAGGNKVFISSLDYSTFEVQPQRRIFETPTSTNQNYPRIDGIGDTLGVVWKQQVGTFSEVMFAHSFHGPDGVGAMIDTLTFGMNGSQVYPDVAVGGGKIHVVFEDLPTGKVFYMNAQLPQANTVVTSVENTSSIKVGTNANQLNVFSTKPFVSVNSVRVVNMLGVVQEHRFSNSYNTTIDTTLFPPGIYSVIVNSSEGLFVTKVSIIH